MALEEDNNDALTEAPKTTPNEIIEPKKSKIDDKLRESTFD